MIHSCLSLKKVVVEDAACYARERQYGQYLRSVTLPFPVKEDKISATFENGVLELRLSKAEESKAKKIEIKARLTEGKQGNLNQSQSWVRLNT